MNRPFWSLRRVENDPCESIEPLLPLYADRMASPEEMRRVEAHLPGCDGCREALSWMQATHRALAARPVALPPADLPSRIAQAIAASSAAPVPSASGVLRPARSFRLRPAYAAVASMTVLGAALSVSYSLWHPAGEAGVKPAPQPVYSASALSPVRPHTVPVHSSPSQTASVMPETKKPALHSAVVPSRTPPPTMIVPEKRVAENVPSPIAHSVSAHVPLASHPSIATHVQMASMKVPPTEKRQPQTLKTQKAPNPAIMPKLPDAPLIASHEKETISVPVEIKPPVLVVQPPSVQTASLASTPPKSNDFLADVRPHINQMHTVALVKMHRAYLEATDVAAQSINSNGVAYYSAIHSDIVAK